MLIEDPGISSKHVFQEQKPDLEFPADLCGEIGPLNQWGIEKRNSKKWVYRSKLHVSTATPKTKL